MNYSALRLLIIVLVLLYIVSPVDAAPGPVDDVVVAVLGIAAHKKLPDA